MGPAPALNQNHLLASLPPAEYARVAPQLQPLSLRAREILHEADQPLDLLYFPVTAIVALVVSGGGREAAVAMVGRDGFLSVSTYLGSPKAAMRAVVQQQGLAYALPLSTVRCRLAAERFSPVLNRYVRVLIKTLAQSAFCRAFHSTEEQAARWFLMYLDRIDGMSFGLTHETLAKMLGVRRATVTAAAQTLQSRGFIQYDKGRVTVTDRRGLERIACECYWAIEEGD